MYDRFSRIGILCPITFPVPDTAARADGRIQIKTMCAGSYALSETTRIFHRLIPPYLKSYLSERDT